MKEEWLLNGAVVPVDVETTSALVAEIKRLIDVVGGMALALPEQRKPLTDEEIKAVVASIDPDKQYLPKALKQLARAIEAAHGIKENT